LTQSKNKKGSTYLYAAHLPKASNGACILKVTMSVLYCYKKMGHSETHANRKKVGLIF